MRVVQSGFAGAIEAEEEFYGSKEYGWKFMLTNLRHYLERHAGAPRLVGWPQKEISVSREEAYKRLIAENGLLRASFAEIARFTRGARKFPRRPCRRRCTW